MVALPIALAATIAIAFQNNAFFGGFVWAWIHGAGPSSFLALVPLAIALAVLWGGYAFLSLKNVRRRSLIFAGHALCVVAINEAVLPATPLKTSMRQRALERVEIRNVRDELFLSPQGHPIGIRVQLEAVFFDTAPYFVSLSTLAPVDGSLPYELQFTNYIVSAIEPPAARQPDGVDQLFQKGVVYRITADMLPYFVVYDDVRREVCLNLALPRDLSEADFFSALSKRGKVKYRGEIHVNSYSGRPTQRVVAHEFVTSREYDLKTMHESLVMEGSKRCR